jgi:hypothetical protein
VYCVHTDKKENKIFLIYKEIQSRAVAKSYVYEKGWGGGGVQSILKEETFVFFCFFDVPCIVFIAWSRRSSYHFYSEESRHTNSLFRLLIKRVVSL